MRALLLRLDYLRNLSPVGSDIKNGTPDARLSVLCLKAFSQPLWWRTPSAALVTENSLLTFSVPAYVNTQLPIWTEGVGCPRAQTKAKSQHHKHHVLIKGHWLRAAWPHMGTHND
jgi:hypothetical protein